MIAITSCDCFNYKDPEVKECRHKSNLYGKYSITVKDEDGVKTGWYGLDICPYCGKELEVKEV